MSLKRKAINGVLWEGIRNVGIRSASFIILLFLARLLDPKDFGLMALAWVSISFVRIFVSGGLSSAIIQRSKLDPEHLDTAFWSSFGVGAVIMISLMLSAGQIAEFFKQPDLQEIISVASFCLIISSLSVVHMALLRRSLSFRALAMRSLVAEPVGGVVAVTMAFNGFGVWSLVAREITTSLVRLVILWRYSEWRPGKKVSWSHFKDLFGFGVSLLGGNLLTFFSRQADTAIIGFFLGPVALGYYNMAYRLFFMLKGAVGDTINSVAWPVFSRLQHDTERLRRAFYDSEQVLSFIVWPLFLGLFITASSLIPLVFGDKWAPSIPVVQVLIFIGILETMFVLNLSVIVALGKPHWYLFLQLVSAILNIAGFLVAVHWGIVSVAMSYVIVGYLLAPVTMWMTRSLIDVKILPYIKRQAVPATASLVMVLLIIGIKYLLEGVLTQTVEAVVLVVAGALTYFLSVYVLSPSLVERIIHMFKELRMQKLGDRS